MNWDEKHMLVAKTISTFSKDRSRKVGTVLVGVNNEILSTGYNGFPRHVNDDIEERHLRPAKYKWTEHSERNAIYNAARNGIKLDGCTAYLMWYPCTDCARALIQSGVKELVCYEPNWNDPIWKNDFSEVPIILEEGNVKVRFLGKSEL